MLNLGLHHITTSVKMVSVVTPIYLCLGHDSSLGIVFWTCWKESEGPSKSAGSKEDIVTWNLQFAFNVADPSDTLWIPELKIWSETQLWILHSAASLLHHDINKSVQR